MNLEATYSKVGETLRNAVNEKGAEIFKDIDSIESVLNNENCDKKVIRQLLLFLQTSNIDRYIPQRQTGITMVDVNNIIYRTESESGLKKDTVKKLLVVIFYALSLPTSLETVTIPIVAGSKPGDKLVESSGDYECKLEVIAKAISDRDLETLIPMMPELNRMADNGYAEALYQKGLCYYYGCGVEDDLLEATKCFKTAAQSGSINAYAALGDCCFENIIPNYTQAFKYYTMLGAIANSKKRQNNIKVILEEGKVNIKLLIINFILVIFLIVFNIFFAKGTFSVYGEEHIFSAVLSVILTLLTFALSVVSLIKWRFNSIRWSTPLIFVIAVLCVFFTI